MGLMKVIIAGGRDYVFDVLDFAMLDELHRVLQFTAAVSGEAGQRDEGTGEVICGADLFGEVWAARHLLVVDRFPVTKKDWREQGTKAGPLRNKRMAEHAKQAMGCCILFPGGRGTKSMRMEAWVAGIPFLAPGPPRSHEWAWHCSNRLNWKWINRTIPMRINAPLPHGAPPSMMRQINITRSR